MRSFAGQVTRQSPVTIVCMMILAASPRSVPRSAASTPFKRTWRQRRPLYHHLIHSSDRWRSGDRRWLPSPGRRRRGPRCRRVVWSQFLGVLDGQARLGLGLDAGGDPEAVPGAHIAARVHHFLERSQPILIGRGHFIRVRHSGCLSDV